MEIKRDRSFQKIIAFMENVIYNELVIRDWTVDAGIVISTEKNEKRKPNLSMSAAE